MLDLKALAQLANDDSVGAAASFDREKSFILLWSQLRIRERFLAEAKKLAHRISKCSQRVVVFRLKNHLRPDYTPQAVDGKPTLAVTDFGYGP